MHEINENDIEEALTEGNYVSKNSRKKVRDRAIQLWSTIDPSQAVRKSVEKLNVEDLAFVAKWNKNHEALFLKKLRMAKPDPKNSDESPPSALRTNLLLQWKTAAFEGTRVQRALSLLFAKTILKSIATTTGKTLELSEKDEEMMRGHISYATLEFYFLEEGKEDQNERVSKLSNSDLQDLIGFYTSKPYANYSRAVASAIQEIL